MPKFGNDFPDLDMLVAIFSDNSQRVVSTWGFMGIQKILPSTWGGVSKGLLEQSVGIVPLQQSITQSASLCYKCIIIISAVTSYSEVLTVRYFFLTKDCGWKLEACTIVLPEAVQIAAERAPITPRDLNVKEGDPAGTGRHGECQIKLISVHSFQTQKQQF